MIFLNYDFWHDDAAMDYIVPADSEITTMTLNNGIYDELYVTGDTNYDMSQIPTEWDFATILHALFKDNFVAGNVNYTISEIDALRLKRRKVGTYDWVVLADFPIVSVDDASVHYIDRYVNAGETVEYALVAVSNGAEGTSNTNSIESTFDGIVIAEKDISYRAFLYDYTPTERNHPTGIVTTLNSKYPFVVRNSKANYTSGQIHAAFLPGTSCQIIPDYFDDTAYREVFTDFLTNGRPKILKLDDGRSWIINVVDNIGHSENNTILYTDFNFVETGNPTDNQALYNGNLIDVDANNNYNSEPYAVAATYQLYR